MTAGKAIANSSLKTPIKTWALVEAPFQGEMVRFVRVEADTACGGLVGLFGAKVCVKDRPACTV